MDCAAQQAKYRLKADLQAVAVLVDGSLMAWVILLAIALVVGKSTYQGSSSTLTTAPSVMAQ